MRDTLEDLYFGKITPNEQDITPGSVLANAMDQAEQCEEKLADRLEGEEKTLLLRLLLSLIHISSTIPTPWGNTADTPPAFTTRTATFQVTSPQAPISNTMIPFLRSRFSFCSV